MREKEVAETIKLASVVFAFVAPFVGLLGWVIKAGMSRLTKAVDSNTEAVRDLLKVIEVRDVKEDTEAEHRREQRDRIESKIDGLVSVHRNPNNLCRLTEVEADVVVRGAKKNLGGQTV